jgi:hypothetical protein
MSNAFSILDFRFSILRPENGDCSAFDEWQAFPERYELSHTPSVKGHAQSKTETVPAFRPSPSQLPLSKSKIENQK